MLRLTIITIAMVGLSVMALSDPLPNTYNFAFFFQVDIYSTIVYSPTQTSVIYSDNETQCFTFRESLQEDESPQRDVCFNETIFAIEYNPQGDRVYVVTNTNDEKQSVYKFYIYEIIEGMISEQRHIAFSKAFGSQLVGYPIVDIAKDKKIAVYLFDTIYIFKENSNFSIQLAYSSQTEHQLVQLQWHPQDMRILFIAGKGYNVIFNLEASDYTVLSNLNTIHMNIMYNGSIVLLQAQEPDQSPTRVYVFSYLAERVTFIEAYTDFVLYKPGMCSVEGNIMGLVRDLMQLHIYNATYQQELIGGTFTFQRLNIIELIPGISDGSIALDGSEFYLRAYAPVKKITRCPQGMYQASSSCEACSSECDTCHFNPKLCTSCNEGYFLSNQKCLTCGSKFRGCNRCSPVSCLTCDETANFVFSPFQNQCNCKQNYQLDEQSNTCKNKSYAWIIGVTVGAVLLIIGIVALVWFIRKKKMSQSNESYIKFNNEDNSAITTKKDSFVKSISSEKQSIEQEPKSAGMIESNDQISQVEVRKPLDSRVDGKDGKVDGRVNEEPQPDGQ